MGTRRKYVLSIEVVEQSRSSGIPFNLYEVTYGENPQDKFRYTDAEQPFTLNGDLFTPAPISRGGIKAKGRQTSTEITVTVSRKMGVAGLFRGVSPRRVIFMRIYEGFLPGPSVPGWMVDGSTVSLIWAGRVLEASTKTESVTLTCDTLGAGMKRPGLTRFYQRECPFVLYGPRCNADKTAATYETVAVSVGNRSITLPGDSWRGGRTNADFVGGMLEWNGEFGTETRLILRYSGDVVTLDGTLPGLTDATPIRMILGCSRLLTSCADLHNNTNNYGGCPYIPTDNPLGKNNHTGG